MSDKKKILIVVNSLSRAGGERYAYELISHLDKGTFDFEVLTSCVSDNVNDGYSNYYLKPLKREGVKIHDFLKKKEFNIEIKHSFLKRTVDCSLYRSGLKSFFVKKFNKKRKEFFENFDGILLIGTIMYYWVQDWISESVYFETHLIAHQAQEAENLYRCYSKSKQYNLAYMDEKQLQEAKSSGILVKNAISFPLSIDFDLFEFDQNRNKEQKSEIIIGVFTRINRDKPLDSIIEAFNNLLAVNSKVKLLICGKILDEHYLNQLLEKVQEYGISNSVKFNGHANNMLDVIKKENVNIIWNLSVFDVIGFATLEIVSSGCAIICNNIYKEFENEKNPNNAHSLPPYFYDSLELAKFTHDIIEARKINELAKNEFLFFKENYNIKTNIKKYEIHLLKQLNKKLKNNL
jgi:glycosyltransferase involved in cell wall biosynthesis